MPGDTPIRYLIVMRHGPAEDVAAGGDAARGLTPEGRAETAEAATGLATLVESPDLVLASPLLRARQTADLLRERFLRAEFAVEAALAPSGGLEELRSAVAATEAARVALVGHEPLLSTFIAWQLAAAATPRVAFGKASVALLDAAWHLAPGQAELRGLYSRRVLQRLSRP